MAGKILFITLEAWKWRRARSLSYTAALGYEEGFRANGLDCFTLTSPWLRRAESILSGKRFDFALIELVHSKLTEPVLELISHLAPIRIGYVLETLRYSPEDYERWPDLLSCAAWKERVEKRLPFMTHVLAADEKDAELFGKKTPSLWWPQAVPARFVRDSPPPPPKTDRAVFAGAVHGERAELLKKVSDRVDVRSSAEHRTRGPFLFDMLHRATRIAATPGVPFPRLFSFGYLSLLRRIREKHFRLWLETLESGCAVLNVPRIFRGYAGRVVEGMARGRPVISAEIPDRPRTRALFADGKEILLYRPGDADHLRECIDRVATDRAFARRLAENALRCVRDRHTVEVRVMEILNWARTGNEPEY